ncbi:hypothetical protein RRF57_006705 [Xylaria bambusicola]|uniref:Uncharacterized protein n=1 Tax=Xylaria bambusicola TaxID=326684 RepID=A0AAN7UET6_9PEZI
MAVATKVDFSNNSVSMRTNDPQDEVLETIGANNTIQVQWDAVRVDTLQSLIPTINSQNSLHFLL